MLILYKPLVIPNTNPHANMRIECTYVNAGRPQDARREVEAALRSGLDTPELRRAATKLTRDD